MNILGNKVVVQCAPGTALTAIAAQTGEQRGFGLIQRGDQLAICQRKIVQGAWLSSSISGSNSRDFSSR